MKNTTSRQPVSDVAESNKDFNLFTDTGRADWFVQSKSPMVVMRMPGCFREVINPAHTAWLPLPASIAKSREGFFQKLHQVASSPASSRVCYCEEAELMIALESQHCPFEVCYGQLEGTVFGTTATSLAFRLEHQTSFRRYQICRLFAMRDDSQAGLSLLEGDLIPFPGLSLRVENHGDGDQSLAPKAILELDGKAQQETDFIRKKFPSTYTAFDLLLKQSLGKLTAGEPNAEVESWLIQQAREEFSGYTQVESIIASLFKSPRDKHEAITQMRARLFDALPTWEMVRCIEEFIATDILQLPKRPKNTEFTRLPYRVVDQKINRNRE